MSKETKSRKSRSTKKSKSELEAKIAELEAKLNQLSPQVKPSEARSTPPPSAQKPRPSSVSSGEVAPAYATVSSTGYTGNKYYATRARLAYHPPDKQFKGTSVATTQKSAPKPELQYTYQETTSSQHKPKSSSLWKARGAEAAEEYNSEMTPAKTRPTPPPAPKPRPAASDQTTKPKEKPKPSSVSSGEVAPAYATLSSTGYTGNKYYATRARLSYHPPDKQYKGESQAATVRVAPAPPKPKRGTLPAGWKP